MVEFLGGADSSALTIFHRQFQRATPLLLDSLSTFTATELLPYEKLVLYAVVAGTLTLGRVEMKKKVCSSLVCKIITTFYKHSLLSLFLSGAHGSDILSPDNSIS